METNYIKDDELHISIKDFIMRLCLKWKMAVVIMILFAIILDAVATINSYKKVREVQESQHMSQQQIAENKMNETKKLVDDYREKLTDREFEEVERSVASYEDLLQKYNKAINYNNKSIKMKLNPNQVPTVVLNYNIDTHYEVTYPVIDKRDKAPDIAYAIESGITSGDIYQEIGKKISLDEDASYLAELIQVKYFENSNFSVVVNYLNKDDCIVIADILDEYIMNEAETLKKSMGDFDIILTSDNYSEGPCADILTAQASQANNINVVKNALNNLFYGLTDDQKNCYYAILDQNKLEKIEEQQDDSMPQETIVDEQIQNEIPNKIQIIQIKYIILGIIIGLFIYIFMMLVKYVGSDKLKTIDDLKSIYKLPLLGIINVNNRKGIDRKIMCAFEGNTGDTVEEQKKYACANILLVAERYEKQNIYIMSSLADDEMSTMIRSLTDMLKEENINIAWGKSSLHSAESLKKLIAMDAVIIVERVDATSTRELVNLINQCRFQNIPVLGSIVLR